MSSLFPSLDPSPPSAEGEAYQSHFVPEELPYDFQQLTTAPAAPPIPVSAATKLSLRLLGAGLCAGLVGNWLLQGLAFGLNLSLWVTLVLALLVVLLRHHPLPVLRGARWLLGPALFFAATFAWRDSATLNALSLLALVLLVSVLALRVRSGKLVLSTVSHHAESLLLGLMYIAVGPLFLLFQDTEWRTLPRDGWSKKVLAVARGLAIATPLLLLFGGLFAAADGVFRNLVASLLNLDGSAIVARLFFTGLWAWLAAGFLRLLFMPSDIPAAAGTTTAALSLGIVEIGTVIGLLDGLFLAFVLVQFRYFFGGRANIPTGRGIEFAEYARHGFFELVWVSVLVLPLLLAAHWLLRKDNPAHERLFRLLAGVKLALLFIIMLSAMQRMRLYQSECGLTELRVYTMAFMGWLALVFVWFAATVLRGQRERFAFGAILLGWAMIAALHLVNPDNLIARVNFQRAREGKSFDANYVASLSADAIPTVMANLSTVKLEDQQTIQKQLREQWSQYEYGDWRAWNWARAQARPLLTAQ